MKKINTALSLAIFPLMSLILSNTALARHPAGQRAGRLDDLLHQPRERRDGREARPNRTIRQPDHGIFRRPGSVWSDSRAR